MRFGVQLGVDAPCTPGELRALAAAAEELPFQSLWVGDHLVIPRAVDDDAHRRSVGGTQAFADRSTAPIAEPMTTLSFLAATTSRIELGTGVLVVPLRNPVACAKMLANVDVLSAGRLNVGVGVGWIEPEFEAVGAPPFHQRGKVTDEYLELMVELWTADEPSFTGAHYHLDGVSMYPKPTSRPHPPIWVGGNGEAAFRRVARIGDGWLPLFQSPSELVRKRDRLQEVCEAHGRERADVRIALGCRFAYLETTPTDRSALSGTSALMRDDIRRYEEVGCEELHLICARPRLNVGALIDEWRRFADEVAAQFV